MLKSKLKEWDDDFPIRAIVQKWPGASPTLDLGVHIVVQNE